MKAWHLDYPGSIDGLVLRDVPDAEPGLRHVRLRIHAVALNNRDNMVVHDQYGFPIMKGRIPLSDCAAEVVEIGAGVSRFAVGDRVTASFLPDWIGGELQPEVYGGDLGASADGVFTQQRLIGEQALVKLAPHLSHEEGATLCCAGLTAWNSVIGERPVRPGETVLVQGSGGVSIFALQIAKAAGAIVIATTSSDAKAAVLKRLGADAVINYISTPDWAGAALEITDGRGVDRVVEVGGPSTFGASLKAVRIGGRIAVVGFSGGVDGMISPLTMIGRGITLDTIAVGSREHFEALMRLVAAHKLRPVIDRVFPFEEGREALRYLAGKQHVGKIVVSCR